MIPRYLRFADLQAARIVDSRPQLAKLIKNEGFPPGVKLAANTRAWTEREVEKWLATRTNFTAPRRGVVKRQAERGPTAA